MICYDQEYIRTFIIRVSLYIHRTKAARSQVCHIRQMLPDLFLAAFYTGDHVDLACRIQTCKVIDDQISLRLSLDELYRGLSEYETKWIIHCQTFLLFFYCFVRCNKKSLHLQAPCV